MVIIVLGYSFFELRAFIQGPSLSISSEIENGTSLPSPLLTLEGTAHNVSFMYLNGRQIYTDESGQFQEGVLLPRGYNVVVLKAVGRFGDTVEKKFNVIAP